MYWFYTHKRKKNLSGYYISPGPRLNVHTPNNKIVVPRQESRTYTIKSFSNTINKLNEGKKHGTYDRYLLKRINKSLKCKKCYR